MGVPAFFRWLSSRNPKIIINAQDNDEDFSNPEYDPSENINPEVDNLYLDMNGIIHPCCHPDNNQFPKPITQEDMFNNVFTYIDKLMNIIRPQKILYMAIDGVAPRAKMNQQRCRRFKTCQESAQNKIKKEKLKQYWSEQGILDESIVEYLQTEGFDNNVITPGTQFMQQLAVALNAYIYERMNYHPLWKKIKVILSDSNIPGEGEHKMLEFIRLQRSQPDYNPDTRHCLYGADADLLMLGLSTHEPHFYIIREQIISDDQKQCTNCGKQGHFFTECKAYISEIDQNDKNAVSQNSGNPSNPREFCVTFQYAKLSIMREYLDLEFSELPLDFPYNLERIIDDFNFMCFFVGNDFLPHIPSLSIREGGIDAIAYLYKNNLNNFGGYLTQDYQVNLKRVSMFLKLIGEVEEVILMDKQQRDERSRQRNEQNKQNSKNTENEEDLDKNQELQPLSNLDKFKQEIKDIAKQDGIVPMELQRVSPEIAHLNYKERWYREKFGIKPQDYQEFIKGIKQSYAEALCWNYAYYYRGCISWNWFYPYHYSPFASDLTDLHKLRINFDLGSPFKPFQQLLAVFPPGSRKAIPECYHDLMTNPESEIIDFYPTDFFVDLKGKKFAWLGEVILPFIDEERLVDASSKYDHLLTKEQQFRNRLGNQVIFVQSNDALLDVYKNQEQLKVKYQEAGVTGTIAQNQRKFQLNGIIPLPFSGLKLQPVENNQVECLVFHNPPFTLNVCELLQNITLPQYEIDQDYMGRVNRRMYQGERAVQIIRRYQGSNANPFQGRNKLDQYKYENHNQSLEKHNNQFVLRQSETGNANFRTVQDYSQHKKQYERISHHQPNYYNNNNNNNKNYNQNNNNRNYNQNQYNNSRMGNNLNQLSKHYEKNQQQQGYNNSNNYFEPLQQNQYDNNYNNNKGRYNNQRTQHQQYQRMPQQRQNYYPKHQQSQNYNNYNRNQQQQYKPNILEEQDREYDPYQQEQNNKRENPYKNDDQGNFQTQFQGKKTKFN